MAYFVHSPVTLPSVPIILRHIQIYKGMLQHLGLVKIKHIHKIQVSITKLSFF